MGLKFFDCATILAAILTLSEAGMVRAQELVPLVDLLPTLAVKSSDRENWAQNFAWQMIDKSCERDFSPELCQDWREEIYKRYQALLAEATAQQNGVHTIDDMTKALEQALKDHVIKKDALQVAAENVKKQKALLMERRSESLPELRGVVLRPIENYQLAELRASNELDRSSLEIAMRSDQLGRARLNLGQAVPRTVTYTAVAAISSFAILTMSALWGISDPALFMGYVGAGSLPIAAVYRWARLADRRYGRSLGWLERRQITKDGTLQALIKAAPRLGAMVCSRALSAGESPKLLAP